MADVRERRPAVSNQWARGSAVLGEKPSSSRRKQEVRLMPAKRGRENLRAGKEPSGAVGSYQSPKKCDSSEWQIAAAAIYEYLKACQLYGYQFVVSASPDRVVLDLQPGERAGTLFECARSAPAIREYQIKLRS